MPNWFLIDIVNGIGYVTIGGILLAFVVVIIAMLYLFTRATWIEVRDAFR